MDLPNAGFPDGAAFTHLPDLPQGFSMDLPDLPPSCLPDLPRLPPPCQESLNELLVSREETVEVQIFEKHPDDAMGTGLIIIILRQCENTTTLFKNQATLAIM